MTATTTNTTTTTTTNDSTENTPETTFRGISEIGDCRITFRVVPSDTVSIVAEYDPDQKRLQPAAAARTGTILLF
jgi:hypothetical protein